MIFYLYLLLLIQCILSQNISNDTFVNLNKYLNNKGASGPGSNFDGVGSYYKCPIINNSITVGEIHYKLANDQNFDNIVSLGQMISLPEHHFGAIYLLGSVNHGSITENIVIVYQDGSYTTTLLNIPDWQVQHTDQIDRFDLYHCHVNTGYSATLVSIPLLTDPTKPVSHLILPYTNPIGSFQPSLHLFSITGISTTKSIKIISVKGTTRWYKESNQYQVITVQVHNTSPNWVSDICIFIKGTLSKTKYHGDIKRLGPGHKVSVDVAILTLRKNREKIQVLVDVYDSFGYNIIEPVEIDNVQVGLDDYYETPESLGKHTVPLWFQSARFGIFIHWGIYSLPSWAPVGYEYAEWYWWNYNQKYSSTYQYHRSFYGPDIEYDDFIRIWNPIRFDAMNWLNLINQSGATYFVFTAKHHDGISLFDTKVNNRSSVKMNPYRDFVKELLDASKSFFPHLKKGIYFSLPEWFHPSYHDNSINWNGPPKNPYTGKQVTYTGAPEVRDFVNEIQVPQILELIDNYQPDIMWCDIGGINNSTVWQSKFLNDAKRIGKQVVMNDRCGNSVSDFTTVEYQDINHIPERFYESTRGIDPHSFGFNHQTKPHEYASTISLLKELISTISKGGNFLLNIGPEGSGHIPEIMTNTLLEMGQWINRHQEAIFDSIPYWVTNSDFYEIGQPLYFMQSKDGKSIYIFSLEKPLSQRLVIKSNLPLHPHSKIFLLSKEKPRIYLNWRIFSNQRLIVQVPDHIASLENLLWVFKVETP